jgi:hypothetical protein
MCLGLAAGTLMGNSSPPRVASKHCGVCNVAGCPFSVGEERERRANPNFCPNNLAALLHEQGDLAGARPLFERALAIREKALGPEHPRVATVLSNLARLLNRTGHTKEAEPMFQRAIAVGEEALGPDHPLTQRYRSQYARLFLDTCRPADALLMAEAALAVHATVNGPSHPWTKDSAQVTADALDALGRSEEAAALREKYGLQATSH